MSGAGEWLPIETAPRDGTQFLALLSNGWYALLRGDASRNDWPYQWWLTNSRLSIPIVETHQAGADWSLTILATHWMPLPPAPETTK